MGDEAVATVIRDLDLVRVALVEELPAACGGGAAVLDDDGVVWVMMVLDTLDAAGEDSGIDLGEWVNMGYDILEQGRPVTCAGQARRFGVDLRVAQAAWWSFALEWWQLRCLATS